MNLQTCSEFWCCFLWDWGINSTAEQEVGQKITSLKQVLSVSTLCGTALLNVEDIRMLCKMARRVKYKTFKIGIVLLTALFCSSLFKYILSLSSHLFPQQVIGFLSFFFATVNKTKLSFLLFCKKEFLGFFEDFLTV